MELQIAPATNARNRGTSSLWNEVPPFTASAACCNIPARGPVMLDIKSLPVLEPASVKFCSMLPKIFWPSSIPSKEMFKPCGSRGFWKADMFVSDVGKPPFKTFSFQATDSLYVFPSLQPSESKTQTSMMMKTTDLNFVTSKSFKHAHVICLFFNQETISHSQQVKVSPVSHEQTFPVGSVVHDSFGKPAPHMRDIFWSVAPFPANAIEVFVTWLFLLHL